MPLWDNDGSNSREIGQIWDNNGSTSSPIGGIWDNNGSTNSQIFPSPRYFLNPRSMGNTYHAIPTIPGGREHSGGQIEFTMDSNNKQRAMYTYLNLTGHTQAVFQIHIAWRSPSASISARISSTPIGGTSYGNFIVPNNSGTGDKTYTINFSGVGNAHITFSVVDAAGATNVWWNHGYLL